MTFDEFDNEKHLYIGGNARTDETGGWGYENVVTKYITIEDGIIRVGFESGGEISALISESNIEQHKGYVTFRIPYIGRAYLYKKERP